MSLTPPPAFPFVLPSGETLRGALIFLLTLILSALHLVYVFAGGMFLYRQVGGIQTNSSGWTNYGGTSYAWTVPITFPGAATVSLGQSIHGLRNPPYSGLGPLAIFLLIAGSVISSYALVSALIALCARNPHPFGRFYWKLVVIILALIWVPVPEHLSLVYQHTVVY